LIEVVLDVSVAAKWVLPREQEDLVDEAFDLLDRNRSRQVGFVAPVAFWAELGNVLWKSAQRQRWSADDAREALTFLQTWEIEVVPLSGLLDEALDVALAHKRSFYDSLYVALAVQRQIELVTADERLANALGTRFPVRWLGSFSIT
jgi:predicted nucleic acid-binding protein